MDATTTPRSFTTNALAAAGFLVAVLTIVAAVEWAGMSRAELDELAGGDITSGVTQDQLDESEMTREEVGDLVVTGVRVIFGGLTGGVGLISALLAYLVLRRRPSARVGLLVVGILGVFGAFLTGVLLAGFGLLLGWMLSGALIAFALAPSTRADLSGFTPVAHGHPMAGYPGHPGAGQYGGPQHAPGPYAPGQYAPGQYAPGQYGAAPYTNPGAPGRLGQGPPTMGPGGALLPPPPLDPAGPPGQASALPASLAAEPVEIHPEPDDSPPLPDAKWDGAQGYYKRWSPAAAMWLRYEPDTGAWTEV
jgi:hypothetical protein